jgi:hypothetical protein
MRKHELKTLLRQEAALEKKRYSSSVSKAQLRLLLAILKLLDETSI